MGVLKHSYIFNDPRKLSDYTDEEIRNFIWYSSIELRPGVFTKSFFSAEDKVYPVSSIRHLLKNIDIKEGTKCLDFGTMNALLPVLMAKRGGSVVTQESMADYYGTVNLVQEAYGTNFKYLYDKSLYDLRIETPHEDLFDVVLFCGIFYHLINPIIELAIARSFLRPGGLMLIETTSFLSRDNHIGFLKTPGSINHITIVLLEHLCRIFCLKPIDLVYLGKPDMRIAFVCRAVKKPALDIKIEKNKLDVYNLFGRLDFAKVKGRKIVERKMIWKENASEHFDAVNYDLSHSLNLMAEDEIYNSSALSKDRGISLFNTIEKQPLGQTFVKSKEILYLSDTC